MKDLNLFTINDNKTDTCVACLLQYIAHHDKNKSTVTDHRMKQLMKVSPVTGEWRMLTMSFLKSEELKCTNRPTTHNQKNN